GAGSAMGRGAGAVSGRDGHDHPRRAHVRRRRRGCVPRAGVGVAGYAPGHVGDGRGVAAARARSADDAPDPRAAALPAGRSGGRARGGALADADVVAAESPEAAESLRSYAAIVFRAFDEWPGRDAFPPDPELEGVTLDLTHGEEEVRHAVAVYATRIDRARAA